MSTIIHNSIGGVGASDRNRTLFKTYTRVYGRPDGDEFEYAVQDFESAGGDICPLTISQLYLLRDSFRAFLCTRGSRFSEGVGAWLDSNGHLQHTLSTISTLLPRDAAIERVNAEILGNAIKTFRIVRTANRQVFVPLSEAIRDRAEALLKKRGVELTEPISLSEAADLLAGSSLEERKSEQWTNNNRFFFGTVRRNAVALKAAKALTSWSVLSTKMERIINALYARRDITGGYDDEGVREVDALYGMLRVHGGTDTLEVISNRTGGLNGREDPSDLDSRLCRLGGYCIEWHSMHDKHIPSERRPADMGVLTYARDVLGAAVTGNGELAEGINSDALTNAIEFAVVNIRSAEELHDPIITVAASQDGMAIESMADNIAPSDKALVVNRIPLPGLFPRHQNQATMRIENYGAKGRRFTINYPTSVLR